MATVDELIQQLETGSSEERRRAAIALAGLRDPKAVPALLKALNQDDQTRDAVVSAIGEIGDLNAIPDLLDAYERRPDLFARRIFDAISVILDRTSPDDDNSREVLSRVVDRLIQVVQNDSATEDVRIAATKALGKTRNPRAIQALIQRLEDRTLKHSARAEAAIALGQIGDINAVPALLKTLDDYDDDAADDPYELFPVDLGETIIDAIGEILSRTPPHDDNREILSRVVDRLIQVVQNDSATEYARTAAAEVLGKSRDLKAVPVLIEQLREDKPASIATAAARALSHFDDSQAIHALIQAATNKKNAVDVREAAVKSLGDIGNPQATDTLISILEDSSVEYTVRSDAALALGRIGDPKAIEPLIRTMENETGWDVGTLFTAIVEALGEFRAPQVTDALVRALSYGYETARTAAETLKKHRDRRAAQPLIRILDDDAAGHGTHTRQFAAELLGVLGDPRAIPALAKALREEEDCELYILQLFCEEIRKAASKSLLAFVPTHPDAILRLPPEDRHLLGRLIQDAEREELLGEICN